MSYPLISIIVPIYKVEAYLKNCLDSIVNQTYKNLEIILIDDGSPDKCGEICDEYAKKDSRIVVIHQHNSGQSAARNAAFDIAKGDYVMLVDPDDNVELNFCERALKIALDNNVELVIFGFDIIKESETIKRQSDITGIIDNKLAMQHLVYADDYCINYYPWNKLYAHRLLNAMRYPDGRIYEGRSTMYKIFHEVNRIYILNDILYHYKVRDDSSIGKKNLYNAKGIKDLMLAELEKIPFLKQHYPKLVEQQILSTAKTISIVYNKLSSKDNQNVHKIMDDFIKDNKSVILYKSNNKYLKIFVRFPKIYPIYMHLAHFKGWLYSLFKNVK